MIQIRLPGAGAIAALALLLHSPAALAQQSPNGPEWFVPGQPRAAPAGRQARRRDRCPASMGPASALCRCRADGDGEPAGLTQQQLQVQLPPAPEIPPVPKGRRRPPPLSGILSVPDVLRVSTAYQAAYKELVARGQKLNEDAQKEQAALRELGQTFANERPKLKPEQIRTKGEGNPGARHRGSAPFRRTQPHYPGSWAVRDGCRSTGRWSRWRNRSRFHAASTSCSTVHRFGDDRGFRSDAVGRGGAEQGASGRHCAAGRRFASGNGGAYLGHASGGIRAGR